MPYDTPAQLPGNVQKLSATAQRQWMHVWNTSYAACMRDEFGSSAKCESEAFSKANGVVKGSEHLDDQFVYDEGSFRLFVEAKGFSSPAVEDGWYPFLPKPGKYQHARYGEVSITAEGNQALVDSVKQKIYQEHIPIDAEHQTKLSGAVAWLTDMRLNEDGSADAHFEWTARGRMLMSGGQFKYVSPEFFGTWPDPATGVVHKNVVAGGALTTRPFFKDKVLRALVAAEDGTVTQEFASMAADTKKCPECGNMIPASAKSCPDCGWKMSEEVPPVGLSEDQVQAKIDAAVAAATQATEKKFTEASDQRFAELETKITAAESLAAAEKAAREAATVELSTMKASEQQRRFSDIVTAKGGLNDGGAQWFGEVDKNVAILTKLAAAFGEDSQEFKDYVEQQNGAASQIAAAVFAEKGVAGTSASSGPMSTLEQMTAARMAANGKLTHAQAFSEVLETAEGAKIYDQVGKIS